MSCDRRPAIAQERLARTADGRILVILTFTSVWTTSRTMGIAHNTAISYAVAPEPRT